MGMPVSSRTVLSGGTVVDGARAPAFKADVASADGLIVDVGASLPGDATIDSTGHVIAAGLIDIHTHYDPQVLRDPALTPSCFHGATTVVESWAKHSAAQR